MDDPTPRVRAANPVREIPAEVQDYAARRIRTLIEAEEQARALQRRRRPTARQVARWAAAAVAVAAITLAVLFIVDPAAGQTTTGHPAEQRAEALAQQLRTEREKARRTVTALRRQNRALRMELAHQPSTAEALTIAAVVSGTPRHIIEAVGRCESGLNTRAENPTSTAAGPMQYIDTTWASTPLGRAGLSRYSPYASIIQAGLAMRHSLSPWSESAGCWRPKIGAAR